MKVRHKATGVELEVREPLTPTRYYDTTGGSLIHRDDPEWELVPEEEWEDCTAGCVVSSTGFLTMHGNPLTYTDFRFRKIDGLHNGPAFIVERRKGG